MTFDESEMSHANVGFGDAGWRRRCDHGCGQFDLVDQAQTVNSKRLDKFSDYARHGFVMSVRCL